MDEPIYSVCLPLDGKIPRHYHTEDENTWNADDATFVEDGNEAEEINTLYSKESSTRDCSSDELNTKFNSKAFESGETKISETISRQYISSDNTTPDCSSESLIAALPWNSISFLKCAGLLSVVFLLYSFSFPIAILWVVHKPVITSALSSMVLSVATSVAAGLTSCSKIAMRWSLLSIFAVLHWASLLTLMGICLQYRDWLTFVIPLPGYFLSLEAFRLGMQASEDWRLCQKLTPMELGNIWNMLEDLEQQNHKDSLCESGDSTGGTCIYIRAGVYISPNSTGSSLYRILLEQLYGEQVCTFSGDEVMRMLDSDSSSEFSVNQEAADSVEFEYHDSFSRDVSYFEDPENLRSSRTNSSDQMVVEYSNTTHLGMGEVELFNDDNDEEGTDT